MNQKFYTCRHCGNIMTIIHDSGRPIMCCEERMKEMISGEKGGSEEKHIPVISLNENVVEIVVGKETHPMVNNHYIEWIWLETKKGSYRKQLLPGEEPKAKFILDNEDEIVLVSAYCNIHGLWNNKEIK